MNKSNYNQLMAFVCLCVALLLILLFISTLGDQSFGGWILRIILILISILIGSSLLAGIREIGPNEIGVVTQFGKPIFQTGPGPVFIPFPIVWKLIKEPSSIIEERFPDSTKDRFSSLIQIIHGSSFVPSQNPLDRDIATEAELVFRYRIVNLEVLLSVIGTKLDIREQIKELIVTSVQSECSNRTLKQNIDKIIELNTRIKNEIIKQTVSWGIEVISVQIKFLLSEDIKKAMNNVPTSAFDTLTAKNKAQAQLYYGLTEVEIEKAFLFARAEGYKKMAHDLKVADPIMILQIDTLSKMWRDKQANLSLYGGTLGDVFKSITTIAQALKNGNPP